MAERGIYKDGVYDPYGYALEMGFDPNTSIGANVNVPEPSKPVVTSTPAQAEKDTGSGYYNLPGAAQDPRSRPGGYEDPSGSGRYYLSSEERAYIDYFFQKYPYFYAKGGTPDIAGLDRDDRKSEIFLNLFHSGRLVQPQDPRAPEGGEGESDAMRRARYYQRGIETEMGKMTGVDTSTAEGPTDSKRQRRTPLISTGEEGILEDDETEVGVIGLMGD